MNPTTTSHSDQIECPHGCGGIMRDLWDFNWDGLCEEIITECGHCLKPITLTRSLSVMYTATADESDR